MEMELIWNNLIVLGIGNLKVDFLNFHKQNKNIFCLYLYMINSIDQKKVFKNKVLKYDFLVE